jgi:hypothetical protein
MQSNSNSKSNPLIDVQVSNYAEAFGANGIFRAAQSAVSKLTLARKRAASVQGSRIARIVTSDGKAVAYQVFQEKTI